MVRGTYILFILAATCYVSKILTAPIHPYYTHGSYPEYLPRNGSHDLFFGKKSIDDRMLFHMRFVKKNSTDKDLIAKSIVKYPSTGVLRDKNITYIEIFDMTSDGNGGYAKIVNGGPGEKNVTFRLESQPGFGFDFLIKVFVLDTNEVE